MAKDEDILNEGQRIFGGVNYYSPIKGYGFIRREKGRDVFFLWTDAASESILIEGSKVSFVLTISSKGPRANEIKREG
ncbi:retron Se72 family effector protein [Giesbergeria anulus]|uniref:Cold shock protein (Beta-ribbon, CspA family) n=1 Tax=Giesbergeria anulus TaxID=180197 RepID=A0A1H9I0G2_9BURK|nr:retron Se72 family effector protein [Giesbergeria anulus]SEQ68047.1 cold shock protein (beta-ribbon, CspA family) [Giesbergeria anulus]